MNNVELCDILSTHVIVDLLVLATFCLSTSVSIFSIQNLSVTKNISCPVHPSPSLVMICFFKKILKLLTFVAYAGSIYLSWLPLLYRITKNKRYVSVVRSHQD
jgi:hypothetical protein